MKRLCIALICLLLFCTPALATDWASLFASNNNQEAMRLLGAADIRTVQMEVADLNALYQSTPARRLGIGLILYEATLFRGATNDSAEAFKPIVPTLIAHLTDPDVKTRLSVMRVLAMLKPQLPAEALDPFVSLLHSETEIENVRVAIAAVARYCETSKQAVSALADAAGSGQADEKRAAVLMAIGQTNCRDAELVNAVATGLRSDGPNIVLAAVQAVARFDPETVAPLRPDLERIAAGKGDAAEFARKRLQR
ncbi:MAG TPA: HEAT repeat domain-containing protein [Terriglobia bacterium]|nr:HEAT repeat domain-containing protein [Terriglobia bacterium]